MHFTHLFLFKDGFRLKINYPYFSVQTSYRDCHYWKIYLYNVFYLISEKILKLGLQIIIGLRNRILSHILYCGKIIRIHLTHPPLLASLTHITRFHHFPRHGNHPLVQVKLLFGQSFGFGLLFIGFTLIQFPFNRTSSDRYPHFMFRQVPNSMHRSMLMSTDHSK